MSITRLSLCIDHIKNKYWVVVENKNKGKPLFIGFNYSVEVGREKTDHENSGWARAVRYKTYEGNKRAFSVHPNDRNFPNWRECVVDYEEFEENDDF